jgi:5'-nucleotidase / UDP-sugar diphosphatase
LSGLLRRLTATAILGLAPLCVFGCASEPEGTQLEGQVHLTLLHTSDIHSRLFPYNLQLGQVDAGLGLGEVATIQDVGGIARMSHIIGRERARSARALHIDGGDCFQGAPVFNFFDGEAEIRSLGAMGVDAMLVANHEFDKGAENLANQIQNWASFPVLVANYQLEDPTVAGNSPLGSVLQPFTVLTVDGLRVALMGMGNLSSLSSIFDTPNRLGVTPLNTTEIAQAYIDLLRPSVDLIVFVSHLGLEYDEALIETTTGIDVVLGGHNHIVLQPPKRVTDCSRLFDVDAQSFYIEVAGPEPDSEVKRYCKPRDVVLAHSGAFAKFVGRLDVVASNDPRDLPPVCSPDVASDRCYDPLDGFEVLSHSFELFPVNASVPEDPTVTTVLEPYAQGLEILADLEQLVGYAPFGSARFSSTGGDSPMGNMIASAMWLRLGIQTDFSLTNTTGIRADLVPGPVNVEQMYNIFPFDNSISKMQVSGVELQDLWDFVARRSAGRGCVSQVQVAGTRVVIDCQQQKATNIYIGTVDPPIPCTCDQQCAGIECTAPLPPAVRGACDGESGSPGRCWQKTEPIGSYELATSNYLAGGGSGFRVLQRNTTQFDTKVQQRDALVDYIRAGLPCGSDDEGTLRACANDSECEGFPDGDYVCACPEATDEGATCSTDNDKGCPSGSGQCVLANCREDVADYVRNTCANASTPQLQAECEQSLLPCASGGEQCKFLACVDARLGNRSDNRIEMEGK